jgi:hypothetical protein
MKAIDNIWYNEVPKYKSGQAVTIDTTTAAPGNIGNIGAGAIVQVEFTAGITNPGTVGNFGCTVKTAAETTAVASSQILTKVPTIPTVPGVASVFNSAGIQLTQTNDLITAMNTVTSGGTIKLTAGTYNTNFSTSTGLGTSFTIQGTDASAANVILKSTAAWALTGKTVVIDSVTIDNTNALTINDTTAGGAVTVSNSNLKNGALVMTNASTATGTLLKDTFTVKSAGLGLTVSAGNANAVAVTTCVFNVTGTGLGISGLSAVTVSGSTFTGAAVTDSSTPSTGFGIVANAGTSTIGTSTFTGLTNALTVNAGTVSFNGNTVTTCGLASPATAAIVVAGATAVTIYNNTITNGTSWIISVAAGQAPAVNVSQNTFTGNAKAATSADTTAVTGIVNMARNWWGAAANVPANVALSAGVTAGIQYTPALGAATSAGTFTTAATLTASATIGVNVTASTGATMLGATALSANPVAVAIPSADTAVKYWDVFGTVTSATVDFYGTTASPVTAANSALLWYNSVNGTWTNTNGTVNAFANYIEITVGAGGNITAAQFTGTPFVLVTVPTVLAAPGTTTYPTNGATNVPVNSSNMTFTWPAVAGAGISYQFALAQASANTTANEFAILDYSDNTITNAEPLQETLQYNTVYWWEVRAVTTNSSGGIAATGPWTVSMFTTAPAPVTTTGTAATNTTVVTSVVITQPVTTVVSTQTSVVITQTTGNSTPAIPSYLLWAVIAVGAVLIIAVIVLIVRTRRIP